MKARFLLRNLPHSSLATLVYLAVFLLSGCGGSTGVTHTVAQVTQVTEVTACEAFPPDICVGEFGFAIDSKGNFVAGPSPTGKTVTGAITPAELSALQAALGPVVQSSSMVCDNQKAIAGGSDTISASFTDGSQSDLFTFSGQSCFLGDMTNGTAFRDLFHQLLTKYYPNPFPA
jgi:hypothetical protein